MEMKLRAKISLYIVINILLYIALFNIPTSTTVLESICIFKNLTGHECWNCGMTRAFLSILQFNFKDAYNYNSHVVFVFPFTIILYLFSSYKYLFKKGEL